MAKKQFALSADQIKPLAKNRGGCFATDMITVEGRKVGYMYREEPRNDQDSGWVFTAGQESQGYMDDADNHGIYDVNTIANYDPDIIPFIDAPAGTAFEPRGAVWWVHAGCRRTLGTRHETVCACEEMAPAGFPCSRGRSPPDLNLVDPSSRTFCPAYGRWSVGTVASWIYDLANSVEQRSLRISRQTPCRAHEIGFARAASPSMKAKPRT